ncbi:MAG: hypothetical protein CVU10_07700 [Bacteroidetes bacterium HGW-Bacteroidetes-5]|jgi:hypothetical protein|nr:MAG: hypothetical protein CVU10_07700 [Bacteroidetes bacterium HGW-Bacteroidetes-5]
MKTKLYNEKEYESLRNEVITRIEIRQQLIYTTITLSGVILGFGINTSNLSFIFPPLAFALTLMWAQNDLRALQISDYLHSLENEESKLGWISYYKKIQGKSSFKIGWPISTLAPGSMFVLTTIMSIGIGLSHFNCSLLSWSLLILDVLALVGIVLMIILAKKQRVFRRTGE